MQNMRSIWRVESFPIQNQMALTLNTSNFIFGVFLFALVTALAVGCAELEQPAKKSSLTFPKGRLTSDTVGLEVAVAQLDSLQSETFETFWKMLDQQELPLELRKRLDQNGLRAAVMAVHPPALLNQLVDPKPIDPSLLDDFQKQLHAENLLRPQARMLTHQRISNREGQSHQVPTSDAQGEISWIIKSGEERSAGFGKQVRGVMSVTTYPQGDGSVRLMIRPEIHHGDSRPRIGVGQGSFLVESSQYETPVDELKFEVTLRPGESLVVAPTTDVAELGRILFGNSRVRQDESDTNRPIPTHRILMVRVVQTQMDDLFGKSNIERLTTDPSH